MVTANESIRGGNRIPLKKTVDGAVADCPGVKRVFVAQRTSAVVPMGSIDISLDKVTLAVQLLLVILV